MMNFKNRISSDKANFYVNGFELAVYAFGTFIYVEQNTVGSRTEWNFKNFMIQDSRDEMGSA